MRSRNTLIRSVEIRICDDALVPYAVLDTYESAVYTERFSGRDSFEITISRNAKNADLLTVGRILHYYDREHNTTRAVIVKQVSVDSETITVSGNDYAGDLLGCRIATYATSTDTGYDTQIGSAETVMRHYIEVNLTNSSDAARCDPVFALADNDYTRGNLICVSARFQTLLELLETCCTLGECGWSASVVEDDSARGWHIVWDVRLGLDRTQSQDVNSWILLSEENGTAQIHDFCDNLPETNYVYVAGQGEDAERTVLQVGSDELIGIYRRESFADARDTDDAETLAERGREKISEAIKTSIEMTYLESPSCVYGRDFDIGDIVTVDAGLYGVYELPVTTVETGYYAEKRDIVITLGAEIPDIYRVIKNVSRSMPDLRR